MLQTYIKKKILKSKKPVAKQSPKQGIHKKNEQMKKAGVAATITPDLQNMITVLY